MNILFITSNPLGDAILTSGVLHYIAQTFPQAKITVAASAVSLPLLMSAPQVVECIPIKKQKYSKHWLDLWLKTVKVRWDLVVDLRGSIVSWLLWAKKRWRFRSSHEPIHRVLQLQKVLKLAAPPSPQITIDSKDEKRIGSQCDLPKRYMVIVPATHWPPKTWPLASFKALIEKIWLELCPELPVVITGALHERGQVQSLFDELPKALLIDKMGASLPETAIFIKKSLLFLGNDSGLMHLSAALDTPTIGLFGPTNDQHYAPWGEQNLVIRTPESLPELRNRLASEGESQSLMTSLSVADVFKALSDFFVKNNLIN